MLRGRVLLCIFLLLVPFSLQAADVRFQWGASSGQVDGYRIYHGDVQNGPYLNQLIEVSGTTLDCIVNLNKKQKYYLVCRAFNVYGESSDSNEVYWKICFCDLNHDGRCDMEDWLFFGEDWGRTDCPN